MKGNDMKKMSILQLFDQSLDQTNLHGLRNEAKILFLAYFTRILEKPVSVLVKGPSSGGKSTLLNTVLGYFPKETRHEYNGFSEKAIIHSDKIYKNKVLAIHEYAGVSGNNGNVLLRQLLSENHITYEYTHPAPDGSFTTKVKSKEGPTALFMTTTDKAIFDEDENRMVSLNIPNDPEYNRSALIEISKSMNGRNTERIDYANWHQLSHEFDQINKQFFIPFLEQLAHKVNVSEARVKRDFAKAASLIGVNALLNRKDREENNNCIIADERDYFEVFELFSSINKADIDGGLSHQLASVIRCVSNWELYLQKNFMDITPNQLRGLSYAEIASKLEISPTTAYNLCKKAQELGYIKNIQPNGVTSEYELLKRIEPVGNFLPKPEVLFSKNC